MARVKFPRKVGPILTPAPYKIIEGGRGKGASWSFARAALTLGMKRKLFIVCAREVQTSIKDSVHKLLADQINLLGYDGFYQVLETEIRGANGTLIVFVGLNNINSLRSMEGIDIFWVTEAARVPKSKWVVLGPTVRRDPPFGPFKKGSEIWIDLNPDLVTDDTYKMFVVDPPAGSIVIHMSYKDNPYFPETLRKQMEEMRVKDYDEYLTTWEGRTRKTLTGAIYAKELGKAIEEGRVGPHIKYDKSRGAVAVFDLGDSDVTAMWVFQQSGNEHNAVYYEEETGQAIDYFIEKLQAARIIVKGLWLPHDAKQQHQSARKLVHNTIEKQAKALLPTPGIVKIVPSISDVLQINAVRSLMPRVNINDVTCSRGVMCLQHFQYGVHPITKQRTKTPLHNWASHGAKAFNYYAVQLREGNRKEQARDVSDIERDGLPINPRSSQDWMGQ